MSTPVHRWKFYRSGGVDQVVLATRDDLLQLDRLDPKLWIALSMPTRGVELDARTLDLLDTDHDGFIRQREVTEAVKWIDGIYQDLAHLFEGGDSIALDRLKGGPVLVGARRLLANLGKPEAKAVSLADATSADKMFADTLFNGDGVVPAEAATGDARSAIEDIIVTHGSVVDRSGKPGVDQVRIDTWFTEAKALVAWHDQADAQVRVIGDATAAAADAVRAVRSKIEDFFMRCRLAAFDGRAVAALNVADADLVAVGGKELSSSSAEVASFPISRIDAAGVLALDAMINPAWQARLTRFASEAVTPLLGARTSLTEADWRILLGKLEAYEAWFAGKPSTSLDKLAIDRVRAMLPAEPEVRAALAQDLAVKPEVDSVADVEKLCRYQRDLATLLNNYVNFSSFYARKGGVFQAGTLYLDGRGCNLVFEVTDPAKHAAMAPMAGAYLAYCDCVRAGGEKKTIAAAFTAGDVDHLFVGRNGVFVDRKGRDWQATITKVVDSPISVRQAFWAPYKKLVRMIEERVAKRASAEEAEAHAKLEAVAHKASVLDKGPDAVPEKKGIDIGTVAALGVAIGGIAAVVTAVMAGIFGLGKWMPLGLLAIMLVISTPSMVLAIIKLRRRNLGPLLDANGWAINALTRINIPFGTALTERALLPAGASRNLKDPYAEQTRPWRLYIALTAVGVLGTSWYFGKLDDYLPVQVQSITVLGARAPAAPAPTPAPAPAPTPVPAPVTPAPAAAK